MTPCPWMEGHQQIQFLVRKSPIEVLVPETRANHLNNTFNTSRSAAISSVIPHFLILSHVHTNLSVIPSGKAVTSGDVVCPFQISRQICWSEAVIHGLTVTFTKSPRINGDSATSLMIREKHRQLRESFIVRVNMLTVLILFCICFASVESYQRDRSQCHNADLQGQCNLCHRHEGCADVSGKTLAIQRECGPKPNKGINRTQMNKKVRVKIE